MSSGAESVLSPSVEALTRRIIGCALQVHRFLGPGLSEGLYEDAMSIELEHQKIAFERQRLVIIRYRGRPLRPQRLDLLVEKSVVVEIKAVEQLHTTHRAQLLSYVRAAGLQVGLLINFNREVLRGNIKRVVV